MARYFQIEDTCSYGTPIREVWIKYSKDKTLFNCFTKESLNIAIKTLESNGFVNVTNKSFTDFDLDD